MGFKSSAKLLRSRSECRVQRMHQVKTPCKRKENFHRDHLRAW